MDENVRGVISQLRDIKELLFNVQWKSFNMVGMPIYMIDMLRRNKIMDLSMLLTKTEDDLLNITNFGQKKLEIVKICLAESGLSLRED